MRFLCGLEGYEAKGPEEICVAPTETECDGSGANAEVIEVNSVPHFVHLRVLSSVDSSHKRLRIRT